MTYLIYIPALVCLIVPAYEDLRSRTVNWYWIPATSLSIFLISYMASGDIMIPIWNTLFNTLIILILLTGVWLYLFVKFRKPVLFIDRHLGLGDILAMCALGPFFKPEIFILFLTSVFLTVLLLYGIKALITRQSKQLIPLVTYLNLSLVLMLLIDLFIPGHFIFQNL